MFDHSMTGAVGFAMHADRLATAKRNLWLAETEGTTQGQRPSGQHFGREAIAKGLMALAARIAPPTPVNDERVPAPVMRQTAGL